MKKHYIFFINDYLPKPGAHLVQIAHLANAAANLGYSSVLVYLRKAEQTLNPLDWIYPFRPKKPDEQLAQFFNFQENIKIVSLPVPFEKSKNKWTNSNTLACKYYFPFHILPHTQIVHTRNWNFVKAAVKHGIPAIYERDHYEKKQYEPEIVNNPLFQLAVTVADTVKEDMMKNGIPSEKIIKLHNGFNQLFFVRQPEKAAEWRKQLLTNERQHLVVYSGELHKFKGIDLLIEVAQQLPTVQFALAGGPESKLIAYQQLVRQHQLTNMTFLGYLPHNQLASLLQAADVLVYPHTNGEAATFTSPMKLFDYIAAGVPIIANAIPPLQEFKSQNVVTYWCEPDNPQQFIQGIKHILGKYPRLEQNYINSIDIIQQYSWENRISNIMSNIDESFRPQIVS